MLIVGILPFAAWLYGPKWLHPYLLVFAVIVTIVLCYALWRYIGDDRRERAAWPSRSEYRWPDGWDVPRYHRVLMTFLKIEDWRILSARAVDADRLLLMLQRDRHHLPVLLVRPGIASTEDDVELLCTLQREDGLWEAALISADAPGEIMRGGTEDAEVALLDYEALPFLAEELEGGPEEERRARILLARQRAAAHAPV